MASRTTLRRRLVVAGWAASIIAGAGLYATGTTPAVGAGSDPATLSDTTAAYPVAVQRAGAWIGHELATGGQQFTNFGQADWGVTEDAILALVAAGGPAGPGVSDAVAHLEAHSTSYTTWDDVGAGYPGVQLAGPSAKTLLTLQAAAGSSASRAALETLVRGLLVADGASAGRFADRNLYGGDSSNGFGQSLAILALSRTSGGVPGSAVAFLVAQQCPSGGFRLTYLAASSCGSDAQMDSDATAMAVQALLAVPRTTTTTAALGRAVGWLLSIQSVSGSFSGTGPTALPNANSTGVIAQALRAAGQSDAADRAAGWILGLQRPAGSSDDGAIGYDTSAFGQASSAGIATQARDQWRRATPQGLLALGVRSLDTLGVADPVPPAPVDPTPPPTTTTVTTPPTTTTTTRVTTTTTVTTTTVTTTTVATARTTTTTTTAPITSLVTTPAAATASVEAASITRDASLAATGNDDARLAAVAVALVLCGLVLTGCSLLGRRQR